MTSVKKSAKFIKNSFTSERIFAKKCFSPIVFIEILFYLTQRVPKYLMKKMIKALVIFGAGLYTGVYVAQNYKIDKVEDPKVLFEKAQSYVKNKLAEFSDDSKKGDK